MKKLLILPLLFACAGAFAQLTLKRADKYYEQLDLEKAAYYYKAFLYKKDDAYSQLQLAKIYTRLNAPEKSAKWYSQVIHRDDLEAVHYLNYAQSLSALGKYEEALPYYNKYQSLADDKLLAAEKTYGLTHLDEFYEDSSLITLKESSVNTEESEFAPSFYGDKLVFASDQGHPFGISRKFAWNNKNYLDLYVMESGKVKDFEKGINTRYHEGASTFSSDGNEVYFTRNNFGKKGFRRSKSGINKLKIYTATKSGNKWGDEKEFKFNSDDYSTGDPFITKDGSAIYFVSDRPGGFGGTDIYMSKKELTGWSAPINLGHEINSEGNERTPFIDGNGVLYFSSEGHFGLGGLDIYKAEVVNGSYKEVVNMGYPLNSSLDDFGFIINSQTRNGYFSSNRTGGTGRDDIYEVHVKEEPKVKLMGTVYSLTEGELISKKKSLKQSEIEAKNLGNNEVKDYLSNEDGTYNVTLKSGFKYEIVASKEGLVPVKNEIDLRDKGIKALNPMDMVLIKKLPKPTTVNLNSKVIDANGASLKGANLFLLNTKTGAVEKINTGLDGSFSTDLEPMTNYLLKTEKPGYLINCLSFVSPEASREKYELGKPLTLEKLELNTKLEVENLYYDLGKSTITPAASLELDKVVQFMLDNPEIKVELGAHTDSRGSSSSNSSLSARRAKSARDYIVSRGIASSRISSRGYGETQILNKCKDGVSCTSDEHTINRRTEIKITSLGNTNEIKALNTANAFGANQSSSSCKTYQLVEKK